jgi:hypothetical protein
MSRRSGYCWEVFGSPDPTSDREKRQLAGATADDGDQLFIEGYTDRLSYQAGDEIGFSISTTTSRFDVEIARLGASAEVVWARQDIPGSYHPVPDDAATHGCRWPVDLRLRVPDDWRSGYYRVILKGNSGAPRGELFFGVRSARPGTGAKVLLQLATNTYNAYNTWGGYCLYGGPRGQARQVSFERPLAQFVSGDAFASQYSGWYRWEQPFVTWAERAGYPIDFAINADLERHPEILRGYRLVLSVGHDEYWSAPMRDSLEAFIANGGNVAFLSGNAVCWQVRLEEAGRTMVSWKQNYQGDPLFAGGDHRLLSTLWCHRLVRRPENQLTGVGFAHGGYHRFYGMFTDSPGGYTVHQPDHWLFAGTGLKRDDLFGASSKIVGYECDGCDLTWRDGLPSPTHRDGTPEGFIPLATAPAALSPIDGSLTYFSEAVFGEGSDKKLPATGAAVLGCYQRGGTVVTSGCTDWAFGLRGHDPLVEQVTRNILDRLSR